MRRALAFSVSTLLLGCGTTLPSEESVLVIVAQDVVVPGATVAAALVNRSSDAVDVGILPCTARIVDQVSREPIAPPVECEQVLIGVVSGSSYRFAFSAPTVGGVYRIEVPTSAPDALSESGSLHVRSRPFTVMGPEWAVE